MYHVQYTDEAREQIESMTGDERDSVPTTVRSIASVDPHSHGVETGLGSRDRRVVRIGSSAVKFWVSEDVGVLTVFQVARMGAAERSEKFTEVTEEATSQTPEDLAEPATA